MNYRQVKGKIAMVLCGVTALVAAGMLFLIIADIFIRGIPSLTLHFLTTPESSMKTFGDGIANAIAGSVILSIIATLLALPFALSTAIYLQRYAKDTPITKGVRFLIEVLSGTPSIVLGIFGLLVFVLYLKPLTGGLSLFAASLALAALILPVIERATEDAIERVPKEYEDGSYALGATKWDTIKGITVPVAFSGLMTGAILGFGRAAEESAVVIATTGYSQWIPEFKIVPNANFLIGYKIYPLNDLVGTMPVSIYSAYENSNVYPISSAFATAFVLIMMVLGINLCAKIFLSQDNQRYSGRKKFPGSDFINSCFSTMKGTRPPIATQSGANSNMVDTTIPAAGSSFEGMIRKSTNLSAPGYASHQSIIPIKKPYHKESSLKENILQELPDESRQTEAQPATPFTETREQGESGTSPAERKTDLGTPKQGNGSEPVPGTPLPVIKKFLRTLLPFAIPAVILLLIAFLATIPPLHHALGTASPFLSEVFATGLSLIIIVAGLAFALLFAKRAGAFKKKTRQTGYAGVVAGFCLVCIAGIICASAASDMFSTGTEPAKAATGDRNAQLAALLAAGDTGSVQSGGSEVVIQEPPAKVPATPAPAQGSDTTVSVPRKNALSVGESYSWGDAQHTSRATIYDYKVLPLYFFWWIDYNRFVPQIPAAGNSYLVIFIRMENTGTQSSVIPSADAFNFTYRGNSTGRLPYLNSSLISTWQYSQLGSETRREQYYQWIREIGQNKRDYAYLTGENLFKGGNSSSDVTVTPAVTDTTSSTTTNSTSYNGAYLKPGRSQAIDGYLIFEVPYEATKHLNETYVDVSFNSLSWGRWKLGY